MAVVGWLLLSRHPVFLPDGGVGVRSGGAGDSIFADAYGRDCRLDRRGADAVAMAEHTARCSAAQSCRWRMAVRRYRPGNLRVAGVGPAAGVAARRKLANG